MVLGHFGSRVNFFTVVCFIWNSRVVGDPNGMQFLGQWTFVLEEFDHNIADYISSLENKNQALSMDFRI